MRSPPATSKRSWTFCDHCEEHGLELIASAGLTEFLRLERKRVRGRILSEADRLECLFLDGFDPHFEGDEPPGL
jgi:hypothetical protein